MMTMMTIVKDKVALVHTSSDLTDKFYSLPTLKTTILFHVENKEPQSTLPKGLYHKLADVQ